MDRAYCKLTVGRGGWVDMWVCARAARPHPGDFDCRTHQVNLLAVYVIHVVLKHKEIWFKDFKEWQCRAVDCRGTHAL